jgi:hypothetical protein
MAESANQARAMLIAADDGWQQAVEERVAQSAEIGYLDGLLDAEALATAVDARAMVGGKVEDPRYTRLFSRPPSESTRRVADDEQDRFVRHVVARITEDADLAALKPHAEALTRCQQDLQAALKRREDLYVPEMKAQAARRAALDQAQRTYNFLYPQMVLALQDPALVESFFLTLRRASRPAAEEADVPLDDSTEG